MTTGGDGDRVGDVGGGAPEARALRGEGSGESGGQGIPPLEASACNPADHPIASDRGLANIPVDHDWVRWALVATPDGYIGAVWQEGDERGVGTQPFRWVHCKVPGCGAEIRNVKPARVAHIRMHVRAAARLVNAVDAALEAGRPVVVTQGEIARRARVDVSSVNKILNGAVGPVFRCETIARVHRIAKKLGYKYPPRGKKSQADTARALMAAAKALSDAAARLPATWSEQLLPKILELDAAIIDARNVWPTEEDLRKARPQAQAPTQENGKAVGA